MCINNKIQQLQQQKAELDAKLATLENLQQQTNPLIDALKKLADSYRKNAPEEVESFVSGVLSAVGFTFTTSPASNDKPEEFDELVEAYYSSGEFAAVAVGKELTEQKLLQNAEYLKSGVILEHWGFNVWNDEEVRAFGLPDERDFVTTHKDWDIFFNIPNGGVTAIQLKSPQGNIYDRSTELDEEYGFPKDLSLAEVGEILEWTKDIIDGLEYGLVPGERLVTPVTPAEEPSGETKPENFDSDANQMPSLAASAEKPLAEFTEFIRLTNSVGYIKRRDNGQILSTYIGLSNKTETGDRTATMASNRARKWAESLEGDFQAKCEVRKPKRMESDNPAMPFAYEVKIVGLSFGQIIKLSEQNFNLLPYEEEEKQIEVESKQKLPLPSTNTLTWSIATNGYSFSSGTEEEMKNLFTDSISKTKEGTTMAIALWKGTEIVEDYRFADFQFKKAGDFDELAPEYLVCWKEQQIIDIRVWSTLRQTAGTTKRLWRHNYLQAGEELVASSKFSAAIHAVRRKLGFA